VATRKVITLAVNGAEYLELEAHARDAGLTVPAYVRTRCGLEPWAFRGGEMQGRPQLARARPQTALERLAVSFSAAEDEYESLVRQARSAGLSVPQYVRTRCEFVVRWSSAPGSDARENETDEAWERLKRLGLEPEEYFPEEK